MKRKSKFKAFMSFLILLSICSGLIYIILYTDIINIKTINVYNNVLATKEEVVQAAGLNESINFFNVNKYEMKEDVIKHPQIKSATISKVFPNTVEIKVIERKAEVAILYSELYLLIDREMVVVEVSSSPKGLYVINGCNFDNFYLGYIINNENSDVLSNAMDLALRIEDSTMEIRPFIEIIEGEIELYFNDEYKALFGTGNNMERQFNDMYSMYNKLKDIENATGIINLKFKGQMILQPFGE